MELVWNLTDLFESEDRFYLEIQNVERLLLEIKKYETMELDSDSFLHMLNEMWDIKRRANTILVYASLRYYKDIKSKACIALKTKGEQLESKVTLGLSFVNRRVLGLGKEKVLEFLSHNKNLDCYRLFLDNLFRMEEHVQEDEVNQKIKEHTDTIHAQLTLYNERLKDMKFEKIVVEDTEVEVTSSNFSKYLSSRDRETRKQAYFSVNQSFMNEEEVYTKLLDVIFSCRIQNAKLEQYDSVLEKVLYEENIDIEIVESLIKSVHHHLPLLQKYLKIKSDVLEIDKAHLYDFGIPLDGNLKINYSLEEAIEIIKNALEPLGKEYLEVVDILLDGHIDATIDEKKHQAITFSWNTYSFMNFRGSYLDLKNLAHELGHIVNYYLSKNNVPFLYEDSTVFVGETASIVNEILLNRYLLHHAKTTEERIFYLSKEIENYITSVFRQTMYTEFEKYLYDMRGRGSFTPSIVSEKYETLLRTYYGNGVLYDTISKAEWMRLGHLYRWSYYPYKYATGLMMASSVVCSLLDGTLSQEKYLKFLSSGSSQYSLDLLNMLGIDMTSSNIIDNGFKIMEEDVNTLQKVLLHQ